MSAWAVGRASGLAHGLGVLADGPFSEAWQQFLSKKKKRKRGSSWAQPLWIVSAVVVTNQTVQLPP